jgi:hypothetical protein
VNINIVGPPEVVVEKTMFGFADQLEQLTIAPLVWMMFPGQLFVLAVDFRMGGIHLAIQDQIVVEHLVE